MYSCTVTIDPSGSGSASPLTNSYQPWTLTATANENFKFSHWNDDTSDTSIEKEVRDGDLLTAHFEELYTVTTVADPTEGGTTEPVSVTDTSYTHTVKATPNEGWSFVSWSDGGTLEHVVEGNLNLTANFEVTMPTISLIWYGNTWKPIYPTLEFDCIFRSKVLDDALNEIWTALESSDSSTKWLEIIFSDGTKDHFTASNVSKRGITISESTLVGQTFMPAENYDTYYSLPGYKNCYGTTYYVLISSNGSYYKAGSWRCYYTRY